MDNSGHSKGFIKTCLPVDNEESTSICGNLSEAHKQIGQEAVSVIWCIEDQTVVYYDIAEPERKIQRNKHLNEKKYYHYLLKYHQVINDESEKTM